MSDELHFFMLDSDCNEPGGRRVTGPQAKWLKGALAASDALFKVRVGAGRGGTGWGMGAEGWGGVGRQGLAARWRVKTSSRASSCKASA